MRHATPLLLVRNGRLIHFGLMCKRWAARLDASFVFVFFLFEPIGRTLLHQQTAPANLGVALFLGLVAAYLFRRKSSTESGNGRE